MVQFEMAAIYSAGLDKADGNEVLPGRGLSGGAQSGAGIDLQEKPGMTLLQVRVAGVPIPVLPPPSFGALALWVVTSADAY